MIVFVDTCSIINLYNLSPDLFFFKQLNRVFEHTYISNIVTDELKNRLIKDNINFFSQNIYSNYIDSKCDLMDESEVIYKILKHFSNCYENIEYEKKYILRNIEYIKNDGESDSTAFCLLYSRYGKDEIGCYQMKTHFITDDSPAKTQFEQIFFMNQIGNVLDTIDILKLFYFKNIITFNQLIEISNNFKKLYIKPYFKILQEIEKVQSNLDNSKDSSFLTKLHETIHDQKIEELKKIILNNECVKIFRKYKLRKSDFDLLISLYDRKKIVEIDNKIKSLNKLYQHES